MGVRCAYGRRIVAGRDGVGYVLRDTPSDTPDRPRSGTSSGGAEDVLRR
ncbi:hypothetical protein DC74_p00019 (plasmid) [Streptomyces noursei]|nr:hypothetical protein DC74_p00019 [Streptomyces noursei]